MHDDFKLKKKPLVFNFGFHGLYKNNLALQALKG